MKQEVALRVLGQVMDWDEDRARQEFSWLQLMARFKYDDYQDYMAGARFVECLADWLQQFKKEDRGVAYSFVRSKLIYFGAAEIQHMVELVYPTLVERTLISAIAKQCGVPRYLVAAVQGIMDKPTWKARLEWDGGSYDGPLSLVSIGNGPRTGGISVSWRTRRRVRHASMKPCGCCAPGERS